MERRQQRSDHRRSSHHLTTSCNQNESRYGVTIIGNFLCRSCEPIYRFRDLCAYCMFRNRDSASWSFFAIARVGDVMRQRRSNFVLVENTKIGQTGIITERDLLTMLSNQRVDEEAWQYASWPLLTVHFQTSLFKAYQILKLKQIRHLIVEGDNGEILGVLALRNILSEIESAYMQELETVLHQRDQALKKSVKCIDINFYIAREV